MNWFRSDLSHLCYVASFLLFFVVLSGSKHRGATRPLRHLRFATPRRRSPPRSAWRRSSTSWPTRQTVHTVPKSSPPRWWPAKSYGSPRLRVENLWIFPQFSWEKSLLGKGSARHFTHDPILGHHCRSLCGWTLAIQLAGDRQFLGNINIISYFFCSSGGFKHVQTHVRTCLSHSLSSFIWPASLWNCGEHHLMWWMGPYDISNSMNIDESSTVSRTNTPIFVDYTDFTGKFNQIYSPRANWCDCTSFYFKWLRATPNFATSIWKNWWMSSILVSCNTHIYIYSPIWLLRKKTRKLTICSLFEQRPISCLLSCYRGLILLYYCLVYWGFSTDVAGFEHSSSYWLVSPTWSKHPA